VRVGEPQPITLREAIDQLTSRERGFTFLAADNTGGERFISFADLRTEIIRRANALRLHGLKPGERVAVVLPAADEFVLTFLALAYAGAIPVPMYPPLSLGKLESYLQTSSRIMLAAGCSLIITSKQVESILWSVVPQVGSLRDLQNIESLFSSERSGRVETEPVPALDDVLFLQFTSGSTAEPKGVRVTHRCLFENTRALCVELSLDPEVDVGVSWLPLYHDMGLIGFVLAPLYYENSIVFIPTLRFIKRPLTWLDVLNEKHGTITFAPNFAYALLSRRVKPEDARRWNLSRVKVAGCGAEPIQAKTLRRFAEVFAHAGLAPQALLPCYGMAEATLAMTFKQLGTVMRTDRIDRDIYEKEKRALQSEGEDVMEVVSCGRAFAGHDIAIMSERGEVLGEREVGEIFFRGPSVTAGYHNRESASVAAFSGGWLRTGDLGYLAGGEVYVCGRRKDLIILNGRNYDPQSLEWAVEGVPAVRKGNVVAFSIPEEGSEALVVACETQTPDTEAATAAIRRVLGEQFSLTCKEIVVLAPGTLPKTSSGKLQRQRARRMFLSRTLRGGGVRVFGPEASRAQLARHFMRSFRTKLRHRLKQFILARVGRAADLTMEKNS
jgi:fatty-acyl-CoA synthase